jgi:ATP-dependent DNA helicase RecG
MSFTLPTNESETVEFKQSFQAEVIETLVAFANAKGGSVYIGLQDDAMY